MAQQGLLRESMGTTTTTQDIIGSQSDAPGFPQESATSAPVVSESSAVTCKNSNSHVTHMIDDKLVTGVGATARILTQNGTGIATHVATRNLPSY